MLYGTCLSTPHERVHALGMHDELLLTGLALQDIVYRGQWIIVPD